MPFRICIISSLQLLNTSPWASLPIATSRFSTCCPLSTLHHASRVIFFTLPRRIICGMAYRSLCVWPSLPTLQLSEPQPGQAFFSILFAHSLGQESTSQHPPSPHVPVSPRCYKQLPHSCPLLCPPPSCACSLFPAPWRPLSSVRPTSRTGPETGVQQSQRAPYPSLGSASTLGFPVSEVKPRRIVGTDQKVWTGAENWMSLRLARSWHSCAVWGQLSQLPRACQRARGLQRSCPRRKPRHDPEGEKIQVQRGSTSKGTSHENLKH